MKKFLEELAKHGSYLKSTPTNTEAEMKYDALMRKFSQLVGKRVLYRCGSDKSVRVVSIVEATPRYVRMNYKYYGRDYEGIQHVCCPYGALISGEDRIDIR
jgi:uncharacterized protein with PIN domain